MEIQWVILAKEYRTNEDTTLTIDGIFHRITLGKGNNKYPLFLIAKLNTNPTEVGELKDLILEISHEKEGRLKANHIPYRVRDIVPLSGNISSKSFLVNFSISLSPYIMYYTTKGT